MRSTAKQPQRHQAVGGPGQVVAAVVFHRKPNVEQEEGQPGEWVAAQQDWVGSSKKAQAESLPGPRELCSEGRGGGVGVVQLVEKRHCEVGGQLYSFLLVLSLNR